LLVGTDAVRSFTVARERFEPVTRLREFNHALPPRCLVGRLVARRPVIVRPFSLVHVIWVDAEVENVLLRNPHVLKELPRRMLEACGVHAAHRGRNPVDGLVEADVCVLPVEQTRKLFT
jgi:hypothetical protein